MKIIQVPMKGLSEHTDLLYTLLTSLLVGGIHMGEISKLGWLFRSVRGNSLYFLHLLLFSPPPQNF
jgi:hypothetical protein